MYSSIFVRLMSNVDVKDNFFNSVHLGNINTEIYMYEIPTIYVCMLYIPCTINMYIIPEHQHSLRTVETARTHPQYPKTSIRINV